jgi:GNAT superfamily N-acetyltransferase
MTQPFATTSASPSVQIPEFAIIHLTNSEDVIKHESHLSTLLQDCVNEGSSIGFLAPLSNLDAKAYWIQVSALIPQGNLHLFILTPSSSEVNPPILGTIQLSLIPKVTHFHRGEVIKLMVSPSARCQGIARQLMTHIEDFARGIGRSMLTLDTANESVAREMYLRLGWEEWGTCKDYASWPDGSRCDATFFRKDL